MAERPVSIATCAVRYLPQLAYKALSAQPTVVQTLARQMTELGLNLSVLGLKIYEHKFELVIFAHQLFRLMLLLKPNQIRGVNRAA
jgi:branched-subunit amino acid transport protein AzlD